MPKYREIIFNSFGNICYVFETHFVFRLKKSWYFIMWTELNFWTELWTKSISERLNAERSPKKIEFELLNWIIFLNGNKPEHSDQYLYVYTSSPCRTCSTPWLAARVWAPRRWRRSRRLGIDPRSGTGRRTGPCGGGRAKGISAWNGGLRVLDDGHHFFYYFCGKLVFGLTRWLVFRP